MNFDGGLGSFMGSPRKQSQGQVNGGRVQRVEYGIPLKAEIRTRIQSLGLSNQMLPKLCEDAPVARFIGIGQCRSLHQGTETGMVQMAAVGVERNFNVSQPLAM